MSASQKALALLDNAETLVCEALLAVFVVLLFVQILARQLFGYSIAWSEELSTYMFVWFAYLGAVVAAKKSAHNRVTFHFKLMPPAFGVWSMRFADLLWVGFNCYFVWLSYDFVFNRMNLFWKAQTLGVPMKYIYMILPIAFTLMSIRILWNLYVSVFRGVELLDPEAEQIKKMREQNADQANA